VKNSSVKNLLIELAVGTLTQRMTESSHCDINVYDVRMIKFQLQPTQMILHLNTHTHTHTRMITTATAVTVYYINVLVLENV